MMVSSLLVFLKINGGMGLNLAWLERSAKTRVARFFLDKIYQITTTLSNGKNISNGRNNIFLTAIKYTDIFNTRALPNLPKLGFLVCKSHPLPDSGADGSRGKRIGRPEVL
jgi:hypothetical protein